MMHLTANKRLFAAYLLILALAACAPKTSRTGTVPLPPNAQLMVGVKTLADAANTAVRGLIAARDAGKISPADCTLGENYAVKVAKLTDDLANEITTGDTGAVLRSKLVEIVAADSLPSIAAASPAAASIVQSVVALLTQLQTQIGGL